MRGLRKLAPGPGHIELVDVPDPEPGPGEVKIAVQAAGVCGTDLHIAQGTYASSPPVTMGHEFSGKVSAVGAGVDGFEIGDRVMSEPMAAYCGGCLFCDRGQMNLCSERLSYGVNVNGGFAESVVVRQGAIHRLPHDVDFVSGAMTEPLAVCVHALTERTQITAGQLVLVLGPGPVGLLAAMLAKAHGATVVVAGTAIDQDRLDVARAVGADLTVTVDEVDLTEQLEALSMGAGGADVTIEAAGVAGSVEAAFKNTRKAGTIVQLGLFDEPITLDYSPVALRELNVIGSFAQSWSSFEGALELMARKRVNVEALVAAILPLHEGEQAFHRAEQKDGTKIILTPGKRITAFRVKDAE